MDIGEPVPEKIFEGVLPYMGMVAILVMVDATNKYLFPLPMEAPHKIWLRLSKQFWRRGLKLWTTDGRRIMATGCPVHFGTKYIFLAQKYRKLILKI